MNYLYRVIQGSCMQSLMKDYSNDNIRSIIKHFFILQNVVLVKEHQKASISNGQMGHIQCGMCSICFRVFYNMITLNEHILSLLM